MKRDLSIGSKINDWEVVSDPFEIDGKLNYTMRCKCGKEETKSRRLIERPSFSNGCRSCGQLKRREASRKYFVGMKIQNLTIIKVEPATYKSPTLYKVECDCGHKYRTGHATISNKHHGKRMPYCNKCFDKDVKKPKRNTMLTKDISLSQFKKVKRNAERNGISFEVSPEDLQAAYDINDGKCVYTGWDIVITENVSTPENRIKNTASLDRRDSTVGYTPDNIQWIHKDLNYMKSKLTNERFLFLCKTVANNHANFEQSQPNIQ